MCSRSIAQMLPRIHLQLEFRMALPSVRARLAFFVAASIQLIDEIVGISKDTHPLAAWHPFMEQLDRLWCQFDRNEGYPGDVSAGVSKAFDQPKRTGSPPPTKTIGILSVAFAAASCEGPIAKMTSTPYLTSSAAS